MIGAYLADRQALRAPPSSDVRFEAAEAEAEDALEPPGRMMDAAPARSRPSWPPRCILSATFAIWPDMRLPNPVLPLLPVPCWPSSIFFFRSACSHAFIKIECCCSICCWKTWEHHPRCTVHQEDACRDMHASEQSSTPKGSTAQLSKLQRAYHM